MTDEQVLAVAVAIVFPVSALIYSNSRVTDVKETLRAEIRTLNAELRGEMTGFRSEMAGFRSEIAGFRSEIAELRGEIKAGFERMESALKQHILEYHK
jgi:hypothetical protein